MAMSAKDDETLIMAAVVMQIMKIENDQMREAIAAWPEQKHQPSLTGWDGCPAVVGHPCTCGADEKNAKRKKARKLAGLED